MFFIEKLSYIQKNGKVNHTININFVKALYNVFIHTGFTDVSKFFTLVCFFKLLSKRFFLSFFKKNLLEVIGYLFVCIFFITKTKKILSLDIDYLNNDDIILKYHVFFKKNKKPCTWFSYFWKKYYIMTGKTKITDRKLFIIDMWRKRLKLYTDLNFMINYKNFRILKIVKVSYFLKSPTKSNTCTLLIPKHTSSSLNKFININTSNKFEFQFLRKNKVYNKGRYSRCRQNYRTGVYMCMYLSIISIFGLYYWFYKFSFNFTYIWWFFIAFVGSFFLPKVIKYRFYEPRTILNSFFSMFRWASILLKSLFY